MLLDTRDEYRVRGVLQSHDSFVTQLDWSDDGGYLASTDGQYHLRFHAIFENDLAQSTLVTDHRAIRDVKWVSQSCVLGFAVQGILETGEAEGYLIQCLEVSPSRGFVVSRRRCRPGATVSIPRAGARSRLACVPQPRIARGQCQVESG